jgi:dTDP-glucose 4,6-dehydratase
MFTEETPYDPRSPYSASKASSDHFVRAWHHTYGLPIKLSNCSNNYGPNHFPEKLIPLAIHRLRTGQPVPVYGKGENVRDWLFVKDHATAIDAVFHKGKNGDTYNIGGVNEWQNLKLIELLCDVVDQKTGQEVGTSRKLIKFVTDRAGHDMRYAIDSSKIMNELGWKPSVTFEQGLAQTVDWYLENEEWLNHVTSGAYQDYNQKQYAGR